MKTTAQNIVWTEQTYDSADMITAGKPEIVIPKSGIYACSFRIRLGPDSTPNGCTGILGKLVSYVFTAKDNVHLHSAGDLALTAGTKLTVQVLGSGSTPIGTGHFVSVRWVSPLPAAQQPQLETGDQL